MKDYNVRKTYLRTGAMNSSLEKVGMSSTKVASPVARTNPVTLSSNIHMLGNALLKTNSPLEQVGPWVKKN